MSSERSARRIVAGAAWSTLTLFMFTLISTGIPAIGEALAAPTPGSVGDFAIKGLTLAVAIVLLSGWAAAIWHAAVHPGFRSAGQRAAVIAMLFVANAASPFFYYFGYLFWISPNVHSPAAV